MAIYMIGYDLNKEKKYGKLIEAIKKISGTWCHPLSSTWLVSTNLSAMQIAEYLKVYMDSDDELLVLHATEAVWKSLPQAAADWIRQQF